MKRIALLIALMALSGCASTPQGLRLGDLRSPDYFRGERGIPMTFPKIQMALIKHQRACGYGPEFTLDDRETSYATIAYRAPEDSGYERTVIADLTQYQGTLMEEERSRVKIYSYYSDAIAKERIEQLFAAIFKPGVCPEATQ